MVHNTGKTLLVVAVIGGIVWAGYWAVNRPDQRSAGERIGDAVEAVSDGAEKAGRQLQDRTPGEKLSDAVKDVGDEIR